MQEVPMFGTQGWAAVGLYRAALTLLLLLVLVPPLMAQTWPQRYVLMQSPCKGSALLPLARGWNTVIVIAVPTSMDVKTMRDLVAMTRSTPGKLKWASTTGAIDSPSPASSSKIIWTWREPPI